MIQKNLKVMDSSAIALAKDNNLVLRVISLYDK
jgi:uridylate kinase